MTAGWRANNSDDRAGHALNPFTSACSSDSYPQRLRAGRVATALFTPGGVIRRRVEHINWISEHRYDRRVSVTVDYSRPIRQAERRGLRLDAAFLGLTPKNLFLQLDVTSSDGQSLPLADRQLDSRVGQAFLVALGRQKVPENGMPGKAVWDRLFVHAYRFPDPAVGHMSESRLKAWALGLGTQDLSDVEVGALEGTDLRWWRRAAAQADWAWWLRRLAVNFPLLAVADSPLPTRAVLKYRWVEMHRAAQRGPRSEGRYGVDRTGYGYSLPLYDFGRAASEHVHVHAPTDTFLTGGILTRRRGLVDVRSRVGLRQQTVYLGPRGGLTPRTKPVQQARPGAQRKPGLCLLHTRVVPDPRGLLVPLQVLAGYSCLLMFALTALQGFANVAQRVDGSLDSLIALMLFAPSFIFPFLFRRDEHELTWRLLHGWRELAFYLFTPLAVAFVLLAAPSMGVMQWVLMAVYLVITLLVSLLSLRLLRDAADVMTSYREVARREHVASRRQINHRT